MERGEDEQPVDPGCLFLERSVEGVGPERRWALFRVLNPSGNVVGVIVENHERRIGSYGPARYTAALEGHGLLRWRSHGHSTPAAALARLCDRLTTGG